MLGLDASQLRVDPRLRLAPAQAVQGGVVAQVLLDAQVQVQGALLEHHTELAQGLARLPGEVAAEHADLALLQLEEAGEQGDQGRLAGAVGAEQGVEVAGFDAQRDALEGFDAVVVGLAEIGDLQRGLLVHGPPGPAGAAPVGDGALL